MIWSIFIVLVLWSFTATNAFSPEEIYICGRQLNNYKRFMVNLFFNLDDTCDQLKVLENNENIDTHLSDYHRHTLKDKLHDEIFSQIIKFAYTDLDFYVMLQNAVMDKCQQEILLSSMLQDRAQKKNGSDKNSEASSEKRNGVIIGKKQRFNPWGGKRSPVSNKFLLPDTTGGGRLPILSDTSFVY